MKILVKWLKLEAEDLWIFNLEGIKMSLEVTLIPLALVVINVLDKEYYESWIKNKRVKKETDYDSIEDFLYDLNKLDYKYDIQQSTVRICAGKEGTRYYFSRISGKWVLSFSEYDSEEEVAEFIKRISAVSNGNVTPMVPSFIKKSRKSVVINAPAVNKMPSLGEKTVNFYPTIYNDAEMLKNVLNGLGIKYTVDGEVIEYIKDSTKCTFIKDENGQYILRTVGNISEADLFRTIQELDLVYKRDVQKKAYESVISKLPEYNMSLEREVRLDDDTIVLTLNVE